METAWAGLYPSTQGSCGRDLSLRDTLEGEKARERLREVLAAWQMPLLAISLARSYGLLIYIHPTAWLTPLCPAVLSEQARAL